jgi:hypothetical protein
VSSGHTNGSTREGSPDQTRPGGVDDTIERLGRWTAARTTRRSFLHRIGQLAVVVAAGPTIAGLLIRQAQARVCGQTGITPKCDTFDCVGPGDVWGWCWYASDGCCRNDGLKKICDCCTVDYPNVHGYCPSGTNVRCIVESCGQDPRHQITTLRPVTWAGGVGYHHAAIRLAHPRSKRAVVADDGDRWMQYLAAPLAGVLGAPLLAIGSDGPTAADLELLAELGVTDVSVVGPVTGTAALAAAGLTVDPVTTGTDPVQLSSQVADRIAAINAINRTVTIDPTGLSAEAAPAAAAFAAVGGFPVAIGSASAAAIGWPTVYIGPEPTDVTGLPADRTTATDVMELSYELVEWATALPNIDRHRLAIAPSGSSDIVGLANLGVAVALHPADRLGPMESWIQERALRWGTVTELFHVDGPGALTTNEYWKLQGAVNGFAVDQLQGVAGEGLPVIRQPHSERPVGMARSDGAPEWAGVTPPDYWTSQAQTFRR